MADNRTTRSAARSPHLLNDVAVLRCTVGNRHWMLGDDPEIDAAFATLNRKLHEMTAQLEAMKDTQHG